MLTVTFQSGFGVSFSPGAGDEVVVECILPGPFLSLREEVSVGEGVVAATEAVLVG